MKTLIRNPLLGSVTFDQCTRIIDKGAVVIEGIK